MRVFALIIAAVAVVAAMPAIGATQPRSASLDGMRVYYESYGQGQEALVFVHGWAGTRTFWRLQLPAFERCRLLLVDLPGHGQSDKPKISYTPERFARALDAVVRDARVNRAIVVGHSLGFVVARQFYRKYPEKTQALIIVDGTWGPLGSAPWLRGPNYLQAVSGLIDSLFIPETPADVRKEVKSKMLRTPQHVMVSAWEETNNPEIWKGDKIKVPVLAVYAPFWSNRGFVTSIATDLDYQQFGGVGHFLMLEKPNEFNQVLRAFLVKKGLLKGCV